MQTTALQKGQFSVAISAIEAETAERKEVAQQVFITLNEYMVVTHKQSYF
jgi:hypothetical protein